MFLLCIWAVSALLTLRSILLWDTWVLVHFITFRSPTGILFLGTVYLNISHLNENCQRYTVEDNCLGNLRSFMYLMPTILASDGCALVMLWWTCRAIFIFMLALVGVFYPYNRGALYTALVVIYALTSGIAGYTAASFYKQLEGVNWVSLDWFLYNLYGAHLAMFHHGKP